MCLAKSRYKLKILLLSFTVVLLSIVTLSVGTISLSANSDHSATRGKPASFYNLQNNRLSSRAAENNYFDFLQNGLIDIFDENFIEQRVLTKNSPDSFFYGNGKFSQISGNATGSFDFAASNCTYTINPTSQTFRGAGGTGMISVTTQPGCLWTAQSLANWIVITSGTSGNGDGTVQFSVSVNSFSERTGRIVVAGQNFTVIQTAECSYTLSSGSLTLSSAGGNGSFNVTGSSENCVAAVRSNDSWITITSDSQIIGQGTVSFTVQPNSGAARTGTITVGDRTFIITQATGCTFAVSSTSASVGASGTELNVNVTTGTGCTWTAISNVPWITVTAGANSSGSGAVTLSVAANTGPTRVGTVTIAGFIFTVTQTAGCTYMISSSSASFSSAGGTGSFMATTGAGCFLLTSSNADWIVINSSPISGSGTISFTVRPNIGPDRTGTITVGGQTYTITQSSGCAVVLSSASISIPSGGGAGSVNLNAGAGCQYTVASNDSWLTITSPSAGSGSGMISFNAERNTGSRRTGTITVGGQVLTVVQTAGNTVRFDFDGDGRADISVFRPETGSWYLLNSSSGFTGVGFGISTDTIVPADYDGDGRTDIAVFRNGTWYLLRSTEGLAEIPFGDPTDIPHPADFNGDGRAELAVFRPSNGVWFMRDLTDNEETSFAFGQTGDIPVAADYDGDGIADIAVYRAGVWFIQGSQIGFAAVSFGIGTDKPVPADYDGDGRADIAVFRPEAGVWYIQRSRDGFLGFAFGIESDRPVPADYDGDGRADIAVYRDGVWYLERSTAGFMGVSFGEAADKPIPNAYIP